MGLVGCSSPTGKGIVDDDASFKIPAIKQAAEKNDKSAIPQLIKDLDSDDAAVRFYAIEALEKLTGENLDYHYYNNELERRPAIQRWNEWLKNHPG